MKPLRIIAYAFCVLLLVVLSWDASVRSPYTPPPPGYSLDNMPRVGIDADYNFSPGAVNAAATSGAKILRVHVSWTNIEPANTDPANYSWSYYDTALSQTVSSNLSPIIVIDKCPPWACPYFIRGPILQDNIGDYTEFVEALVSRYSRPPYNVHYWELFDEPDGAAGPEGQWGYGNNAEEYVQVLRILYETVKSVDPESVVMNGGLAYDRPTIFRTEFLSDTLAYGGAQYMDALNFHYFRINGPGWATIGQKAEELRQVMRNYGVNLPLVCTSVGESSENITPWNSDEAQQARYLIKVNAQSAAAGIRSTTWYLVRDFDCQPSSGCPAGWEAWSRHGIVRLDGETKPAHQALQVFAQEIGSGVYLRQLGPESGVTGNLEGYHFGGSSAGRPQVSVVWNNDSVTATLTLPASRVPSLIRVLDMFGQPISTTPEPGGMLNLSVGNDPIYLEWESSRFVDVPETNTFYPYIESLAQTGAVLGFPDGTFRPNANAMRGHISKIMVLAQGWPLETTGGPHFRDVPVTSAFYPYVETAYNRGVISGYSDGTFRPYNTVTRGQLCKIIANARGWYLANPTTPTFSDVSRSNPFYRFIETAYARGIITGYSDGTFRWGAESTRGQVSKIIYFAIYSP